MPKLGILHDYDLMANREDSAHGQTCIVCGTFPMSFQWSDYSGEAMCRKCGCSYQLKWGSDEQKKESKYPYLNLQKEFIPTAREYWNETKRFVCYGWMMGPRSGMAELVSWLQKYHPYWMLTDEQRKGMNEIEWNKTRKVIEPAPEV